MHLGRYEVLKKIGGGGFGEVLLARSSGAEGFERIVALKRLKGKLARQHLKGIINEARIGGLLSHPNIVQVLEFIRLEAGPNGEPEFLLVMEYVDGLPLQEILDYNRVSEPLLTPGLAIDFALQVCEGLHYAHSARAVTGQPLRLIHRDIKPSNLMVTRTGTVKIMDFGVAKAASNTGHSSTGTIKGTLRYLSPEQAEGSKEIGHESDLFSLGLVLCEMVTGRPVYEAEQEHLVLLRALQAQTGDAVKLANKVAPGLGPILSQCLAPEPEERYRTAEELAQALRMLKRNHPSEYGLSTLVERALALRRETVPDEAFSTETSFSLELRRKDLESPHKGWEILNDEPEAEDSDAAGSSANPVLSPEQEITEVDSKNPSNEWEWEWRLTDSRNAIRTSKDVPEDIRESLRTQPMLDVTRRPPPREPLKFDYSSAKTVRGTPSGMAGAESLKDLAAEATDGSRLGAEEGSGVEAPAQMNAVEMEEDGPEQVSLLHLDANALHPEGKEKEVRRLPSDAEGAQPLIEVTPDSDEGSSPDVSPPGAETATTTEVEQPSRPPRVITPDRQPMAIPPGAPAGPEAATTAISSIPGFVAGIVLGLALLCLGFVLGMQYVARM